MTYAVAIFSDSLRSRISALHADPGVQQIAPPLDLNFFLSPESFWRPAHKADSAWIEHAPFAFWLVGALRPHRIVELGTHRGFSYLAFCQAVKQLGLPTQCFAVDTWRGDDQTGHYGEDVHV